MLAAAEGRKESGLMVARVLEQPRDVGRWLLGCLQQPKDEATEGRKEDEFSWLLRSLPQPREVDFA
ncbi:hypothetical protein Pyn_39402 [Prunus yedoensis var. nudiflora]|uniref:Uncharacterized protein n=1 Tax=Prunus yedoensis var. nudiflora TaxID=2094558 RepID=A0A314Z2B7_PRUYE|nr:hypothetical protein Pyn_39402 [Prunus yedoensis var. nudiflora]